MTTTKGSLGAFLETKSYGDGMHVHRRFIISQNLWKDVPSPFASCFFVQSGQGQFRFIPKRGWKQRFRLTLSLPSSKSTFFQPFKEKCISEVMSIGRIIIFRLSKLWKPKFFILCDAILLVRLQEKFEIDHSTQPLPNVGHFVESMTRVLEKKINCLVVVKSLIYRYFVNNHTSLLARYSEEARWTVAFTFR